MPTKEVNLRRKAKGLCAGCGKNTPSDGMLSCGDCRYKSSVRRRNIKTDGICIRCNKNPSLPNITHCRLCNFKMVAKRAGLKNSRQIKEFGMKLVNQSFRCPYTGIRIGVGNKASIDHIVPRAKGGTDSMDNLEWVHLWVNWLKKDMDKTEFTDKFNEFLIETVKFRFGVDLKSPEQ